MTRVHKEERIHLRVQSAHHELIERAAQLEGMTLTAFATRHLVEAAEKVVERQQVTELHHLHAQAFWEALHAQEKPPGVERLQRLFGTLSSPSRSPLDE